MKAIDKKGWVKVKFGDVCRNLNVTTKTPIDSGFNKVIGLENLVSGSLHIQTWGDVSDGTTFTKTFLPGHVLFGKRRAYLKKAAVAEFKGICSGDILVFEAIKEKLNPKLLPFLVSSDRFFDHAIKTSAGSLSPRTKFQDLANFEFFLPPKDQQEKLAELLWAGDDCSMMNKGLRDKMNELLWCLVNLKVKEVKRFEKLGDHGELFKGKGIAKSDIKDSGLPAIRYGEIYTTHHVIYENSSSFIDEATKGKSVKLQKGDILFAGSGETMEDIGKAVAIDSVDELYAGSDIVIFRPNDDANPFYWGFILNSQFMRTRISRLGKGAQVVHIYANDLAKLDVPMTDINGQNLLGTLFNRLNCMIKEVDGQIQISSKVNMQLKNSIFNL